MGPRAARYRVASLTRAAMLYRRALNLKRGEVPAEGTKETPLCMDTFRCVSDDVLGWPDLDAIIHEQVDVRLRARVGYRGPRLERVTRQSRRHQWRWPRRRCAQWSFLEA